MNSEMRGAAVGPQFCGGVTDDVIYVALTDIEEVGLVLKTGMIVLFKISQNKYGIAVHMVTSF